MCRKTVTYKMHTLGICTVTHTSIKSFQTAPSPTNGQNLSQKDFVLL